MSTFLYNLVDGKPNEVLVDASRVEGHIKNGYCFDAKDLVKSKKKSPKKASKAPIED